MEERIIELKDRLIEKDLRNRKKKEGRKMNRALETGGIFKCMNTHTIPGEKGAKGIERISEEIMAETSQI